MSLTMRRAVVCAAALNVAFSASGQVGPDGIDWVTIGAVGNRGYDRDDPFGYTIGRGSVNYEYRMGRFEVTAAQWVEFLNAAWARTDRIPYVFGALSDGIRRDENYQGPGERYVVRPGGEMLPATGVTWRQAAVYCNWLHNNKATDRSAFLNGAYDVSTFGYTGSRGDIFTDQRAHDPGARYWIPTLDEWLKAAHFDPRRVNDDGSQGGWWLYGTTSDRAPRYAPPWAGGEANAGFELWDGSERRIPLGAYETTSPWGLYDTAGGTTEWLEEVAEGPFPDAPIYRWAKGSALAWPIGGGDLIYSASGEFPSLTGEQFGFRLASAVPSPSAASLLIACALAGSLRGRRPRS